MQESNARNDDDGNLYVVNELEGVIVSVRQSRESRLTTVQGSAEILQVGAFGLLAEMDLTPRAAKYCIGQIQIDDPSL